jgi:hypothetical protein
MVLNAKRILAFFCSVVIIESGGMGDGTKTRLTLD